MSQISLIIAECTTFRDVMTRHAQNNDLFRFEPATTKLTVNIIGKIVLDVDLNAQNGRSVLADGLRSNVRWQAIGAHFQPSELWDIRRPIIQRWNNWRMNRYLSDRIDERFASRNKRGRTKHVVDLALEAYLKEVKGKTTAEEIEKIQTLDPEFKEAVISNIKTFVFAGHDTTSSTICYAFYYLSKDPVALARVRKEHDEVFGMDPDAVEKKILEDPYRLNKLDYTFAVIRETLRLQPPVSTIRTAPPG